MKRSAVIAFLATALLALSACDDHDADAPPALRPGEDVCVQCNMIISDVRWATATIVEGPRGPEARLFDDFNCQVNWEVEHEDAGVVARWSHDHGTSQWMPTHEAAFLMSPTLRTPMGSRTAAFGSAESASQAGSATPGDVVTFEIAWKRLGFTGAPCHHKDTQEGGSP